MDCACHGEPMLWTRDARYRAGGFWYCAVKNRMRMRAYYVAHRDAICAQRRDRYDADPVYRISRNLKSDANARRRRLNVRKEALYGALPE